MVHLLTVVSFFALVTFSTTVPTFYDSNAEAEFGVEITADYSNYASDYVDYYWVYDDVVFHENNEYTSQNDYSRNFEIQADYDLQYYLDVDDIHVAAPGYIGDDIDAVFVDDRDSIASLDNVEHNVNINVLPVLDSNPGLAFNDNNAPNGGYRYY